MAEARQPLKGRAPEASLAGRQPAGIPGAGAQSKTKYGDFCKTRARQRRVGARLNPIALTRQPYL